MACNWEAVTFVRIQAFILSAFQVLPIRIHFAGIWQHWKVSWKTLLLEFNPSDRTFSVWVGSVDSDYNHETDHNYLWPLIGCVKIMKFSSGNSLLTSTDRFMPRLQIKEHQGVWLVTSHTWCLVLPLFACCSFFPFTPAASSCLLPTSVYLWLAQTVKIRDVNNISSGGRVNTSCASLL